MSEDLKEFKSQPWVIFDTIASYSFLVGETDPALQAFNTGAPAISSRGEMIFFAAGRTEAQAPWYTSTELVGQLSYGFEAWQVFLYLGLPVYPSSSSNTPIASGAAGQVSPMTILANCILNFGVLEMRLGQEEQMDFPCTRFGAGGGLRIGSASAAQLASNGVPEGSNVLALPDAIDIARTQNLDARIRLADEVLPIIGNNTTPGVGLQQNNYLYTAGPNPPDDDADTPPLPMMVRLGFIGRRVKKTQYGQLPDEG